MFDRYKGVAEFSWDGLGDFSGVYFLSDVAGLSQESIGDKARLIRSLDEIPKAAINGALFFVLFTCDSDAYGALLRIVKGGGRFRSPKIYRKVDYRFANRRAFDALRKTWSIAERLSHLDAAPHENICEALELTRGVSGDYVEVGVYMGGSAVTALNYLDLLEQDGAAPRRAWLFDTFDGFNYAEAETSADQNWFASHKLMGVEKTMSYIHETIRNFAHARSPFELVACNICADPLPEKLGAISVLNVDVDMYEATAAALKRLAPQVSSGGIVVCEDPTATPALYGAYLAMREFLEGEEGRNFTSILKPGGYFLMKK